MTLSVISPEKFDLVAAPSEHGVCDWTVGDIIAKEQENGQQFGSFHRNWLLKRAPNSVREYQRLGSIFSGLKMADASFSAVEGQASAIPTSATAVTASATETQLWVPAIWTPIPANSTRAGKVFKIAFGGVFTSTATQGVLTWTPRYGVSATVATNPTLGASNATAPAASLTTQAWYGEFYATIRALGLAAAGGTITGNGMVVTQGAAAATGTLYVMGGTVAAAFDNTAISGLIMNLTISVASQSYTCQWVTPVHSI